AAGWQANDDTWRCTDRKDLFGRVLEEQGRVVWITPGACAIPRTPAERDAKAHAKPIALQLGPPSSVSWPDVLTCSTLSSFGIKGSAHLSKVQAEPDQMAAGIIIVMALRLRIFSIAV
ncbi:unnamed protein product, partial [Polarella glacialis]